MGAGVHSQSLARNQSRYKLPPPANDHHDDTNTENTKYKYKYTKSKYNYKEPVRIQTAKSLMITIRTTRRRKRRCVPRKDLKYCTTILLESLTRNITMPQILYFVLEFGWVLVIWLRGAENTHEMLLDMVSIIIRLHFLWKTFRNHFLSIRF